MYNFSILKLYTIESFLSTFFQYGRDAKIYQNTNVNFRRTTLYKTKGIKKMLDFLKTHFFWINLGHIVVTTLLVLGILRPISSSKSRMKERIIRRLIKRHNRGEFLLSEIRLRDNLLLRPTSFIFCVFLKNFYTSFADAIWELETEDMIMRVINSELDKGEEKYPLYSSKAKKTPVNYGLKKDNPTIYLGLNSPEVKEHIAVSKKIRELMMKKKLETVSNEAIFRELALRGYDLTELQELVEQSEESKKIGSIENGLF